MMEGALGLKERPFFAQGLGGGSRKGVKRQAGRKEGVGEAKPERGDAQAGW